jgi:SAM-dependent methyltransferase
MSLEEHGRVREYYARRAGEYDATSWDDLDVAEREAVERFVAALSPGRVLDIGCGTGYLTRLLRGTAVGVDQSEEMLALARRRVPHAEFLFADVPPLPFEDGAFDLAFSSAVYCHLAAAAERAAFLAEALRVAHEVVILEQVWQPGRAPESWELRRLRDGSEYRVFKRYFTADALARELDGVTVFESAEAPLLVGLERASPPLLPQCEGLHTRRARRRAAVAWSPDRVRRRRRDTGGNTGRPCSPARPRTPVCVPRRRLTRHRGSRYVRLAPTTLAHVGCLALRRCSYIGATLRV